MPKVKVFDSFKGKEVDMDSRHAAILSAVKPQRYRTRDMIMERASSKAAEFPEVTEVFSEQELDSAGEGWDQTLHLASKVKNADGTWRKRPGGAKVAHE